MKKILAIFAFALVAFIAHAQSCPDDHHPHMIDLGLPSGTKWACCNVGAYKPEAYGGYYAWGETEEKSTYSWSNYIHCDGSRDTFHYLGSEIAGSQYDVAHIKWGGAWVIPSKEQIQELLYSCNYERAILNGINGVKYIGKNGASIFLPAAGYRIDSDFINVEEMGFYWSSSMGFSHCDEIYGLCFDNVDTGIFDRSHPVDGNSVRPVCASESFVALVNLEMITGTKTTVEINSGSGSYTIESSDENIITAFIQDNTITMTAVSEGKATIIVTDMLINQVATIDVTVISAPCPDDHHPHLIDLGLPSGTKWACCNVGADNPEGYGGYYAWGETKEKSAYNAVTYQYATGVDKDGDGRYDDYHSDVDTYGLWQYLGDDIAGTQYDVAQVQWGGEWRIPSDAQVKELLRVCSYKWMIHNGVNGCEFTSYKNGASIFLPAAGYRRDSDLIDLDSWGLYTSSMQDPDCNDVAYRLKFNPDYVDNEYNYYRSDGFSVRPVISGTTDINLPKPSSDTANQSIYNLYGIKVSDKAADMNTLPPGIYIVNGKKMVVK